MKTRIEQIREMSDEELAAFLVDVSDRCPSFCKYCDEEGVCTGNFGTSCVEGVLAYLRSKGKPDDHLTPPLAEQPKMYDDQEGYVPGLDYWGRPVKGGK